MCIDFRGCIWLKFGSQKWKSCLLLPPEHPVNSTNYPSDWISKWLSWKDLVRLKLVVGALLGLIDCVGKWLHVQFISDYQQNFMAQFSLWCQKAQLVSIQRLSCPQITSDLLKLDFIRERKALGQSSLKIGFFNVFFFLDNFIMFLYVGARH